MILPSGFSWAQARKPKSPQQQDAARQDPASNLSLDQLGEQGEQMAERINSISSRFEDVLSLRDEFGVFIQTFDEIMGAHKQARTKLAEQAALLTQHLNASTALRRELTDLQTRLAAADAEVLGLRHELGVLQQQAHDNAETINALKLEASESASRATSVARQLMFEQDKNTALQEANAAKDLEVKNLDRQHTENQKQIIELKNALGGANSEVVRLQNLINETHPELQRSRQRQSELETALHKAELATRGLEEKLAQHTAEREALVEKHGREKNELASEISGLNLQLDGLNSRHAITLQHLEHARAAHDESFEAQKQWERSSKQAKAALAATERRLQLSEEQLHALEGQRTDLEKSLADMAARNEMLTKAIAAKDAQIGHLQNKASSFESRYASLLHSHENEHLQHEAAKRRLLEMLESEKAERALAQGALSIARASREKMSVQIDTLKRGRGNGVVHELAEPEADNSNTTIRSIPSSDNSERVKEIEP